MRLRSIRGYFTIFYVAKIRKKTIYKIKNADTVKKPNPQCNIDICCSLNSPHAFSNLSKDGFNPFPYFF